MTLVAVQRQKVNQIEYSSSLFLSSHSSPSLLLFALLPCGCKQDYLGFVRDMSKPWSFKPNRFQNILVSSLNLSKHVKIRKKEELNKQSHWQHLSSSSSRKTGCVCVCARTSLECVYITCCVGPRPNIPRWLLGSVGSTTQILADGEMTLLRFVI